MEKQSVVVLFPDEDKKNGYLQQMKAFLEKDTTLSLHSSFSIADMDVQIQNSKYALAIFSIQSKTDLVEVVQFLGAQAEAIKNNHLRVIGSSTLSHPDVVKILMKKGCADILPSNLNQKALRHKISQSFKILENYRAKLGADNERRFKTEELKKEQKDLRITLEKPDLKLELRDALPCPQLVIRLESSKGSVSVKPLEYSDRELLVEAASGSLGEGQRYSLVVECSDHSGATKESFSALVKDVQKGDGTLDMMSIKILDDAIFPTKKMNAALVKRQDEIFDFLKLARGW